MNRELMQSLEQVAREKGLPLKVIVEAMISAIELAARKRDKSRFDVRYDEATGMIRLYAIKEVVQTVVNPRQSVNRTAEGTGSRGHRRKCLSRQTKRPAD